MDGAGHVSLAEVPIAEWAPILKEYLPRALVARLHVDVAGTAPVRESERIAGSYRRAKPGFGLAMWLAVLRRAAGRRG